MSGTLVIIIAYSYAYPLLYAMIATIKSRRIFMGNQEKKKGIGIAGLILSLILSAAYSFIVNLIERFYFNISNAKFLIPAFIFGVVGALIVLSIWKAITKKFTVFTRNPIGFYTNMYVCWPFIGAAVGHVVCYLFFGNFIK
jgi:uncharacterized membrane protein YeaQ/YmgE (transglycosylase-associated protein family)